MADKFEGMAETLASPAASAFDVTPNDVADLPTTTRGITVVVGGAVTADFLQNGTNITVYCLAGIVYPYRLTRVYAAGTDATGIVGLY